MEPFKGTPIAYRDLIGLLKGDPLLGYMGPKGFWLNLVAEWTPGFGGFGV